MLPAVAVPVICFLGVVVGLTHQGQGEAVFKMSALPLTSAAKWLPADEVVKQGLCLQI